MALRKRRHNFADRHRTSQGHIGTLTKYQSKQHSLTGVLFLRSKEKFDLKLIIAEKLSVALAIAKALNIKGSRDGYIENGLNLDDKDLRYITMMYRMR